MNTKQEFTYLALGDSYTAGEAVNIAESWPFQLAKRLEKDSIKIDPVIVATTSWTTNELISGIVEAKIENSYDFVSLSIGVNNQYRGYPISQYEREFTLLLNQAIQLAGDDPHHVIVVSIPDYGITPFARERALDKNKIATELDHYNAIAEKLAILRGVKFIDVISISRKAADDPTLISSDGLHPSEKMYKMWIDHLYDHVYYILSFK